MDSPINLILLGFPKEPFYTKRIIYSFPFLINSFEIALLIVVDLPFSSGILIIERRI
jgi:hypothetical protein